MPILKKLIEEFNLLKKQRCQIVWNVEKYRK